MTFHCLLQVLLQQASQTAWNVSADAEEEFKETSAQVAWLLAGFEERIP